MSEYGWIKKAFIDEGFSIPTELNRLIRRKKFRQGRFTFYNEEDGNDLTEHVNNLSDDHRVIAFARRRDFEAVICLMLEDKIYGRGSVLVLDYDRPRDYDVDFTYPSIQAWAQEAEEDIASCIEKGWDEPYDDDTSDK